MRLNGWEWIIILVIVLLLWGAPKLPSLAKSLGESIRLFRKEMKTDSKKPDAEGDKGDKTTEK